ncbi:MAG TPA: UDP-N-acetylmuramoyl-L-alanine--D-glutamate ligase [Solirubrobacteraceae bacterium]|jgi:UDP-N-acetylmuramoylalanine--D-glutamate ligase
MTSVRFSELDGAAVGVWGAGREITSFADQLARRMPGASIVAAVFDAPPDDGVRDLLRAPAARILGPEEAVSGLGGCDVIVRSPGVSSHRPELSALRDAGVTVTTATGLWLCEHGGGGVIGVTGTKGKSTTAALACHLVRAAGRRARLAGNIGAPALDLFDDDDDAIVILELSSYQIADLLCGPEVALVTNLFREHTEWHGSEDAYRADKLRLLDLPGVRVAVVNGRDRRVATAATAAARVEFGTDSGWNATEAGLSRRGELVMPPDAIVLPGEHNLLNLCAALTALGALGVSIEDPAAALEGFEALPHRLQPVADSGGLTWIDDSISTTPESAIAALASFPGRELVLIGGGQDRGQDYAALGRALAERGARVIGVPSTGSRLIDCAVVAGLPPASALTASDLPGAVELARELAPIGAVVLLSPAAPSFDQYRDFEQRGELFAALARSRPA